MTTPTLRRVARIQRGAGFPPEYQGKEDGELPFFKVGDFAAPGNEHWLTTCDNWVSRDDAVTLRASVVPAGSVLLPKIGAALLGNARRITTRSSVFDNNVLAVVPDGIDSRYLFYWLCTLDLAELAQPGPVPSLNDAAFLDQRTPITDAVVQRTVANYLDAETARIDAVIYKKRQLVDLVVLRPSLMSEELLGPSRLRCPTSPLKYLVSERDERLQNRDPPTLLSVSIHLGVVPRDDLTDKLPRAEELSNYKICRSGDIVLNRMRAFQGGVGVARQDGIVSPDYTVIEVGPRLKARFAHYLMRTPWFVGEMISRLRGIGGTDQGNVRTPRVGFGDLGMIEVPVPSLALQSELVSRLDGVSKLTRRTGNSIARQLSLLEEHRQALITAAVTGQLHVPGVAA